MLYDHFKPIVDLILNNWTALQLAVEHGMGAPGGKETAQLMSVYVARHCVETNVDRHDLIEMLEDLMDEEFETVCHDDSPAEIATLLLHFLQLLKEGRHDEIKTQIEAMPKCQVWLSQPEHKSVPPQCHGNPYDDSTSSGEDEEETQGACGGGDLPSSIQSSISMQDEPMEEDPDPGWTTVRARRKK